MSKWPLKCCGGNAPGIEELERAAWGISSKAVFVWLKITYSPSLISTALTVKRLLTLAN